MCRKLLCLIATVFSCYFAVAQTFSPDKNGYVADPKFHQLIKSRGYELVGTFDTLQRNPLLVAASFQKNGKWGLIDNHGKVIKEATSEIRDINAMGNQGKSGPGSLATTYNGAASYEAAARLRKLLYFPYDVDGKHGTKDTTGKIGIPPVYDRLFMVGDTLAVVVLNRMSGLFTASGKELVAIKYDNVSYSPKGRRIYIVKKGLYTV